MVIIGVNCDHADASVVISRDNEIIFASEAERFDRIKHSAKHPLEAVSWAFDNFGLDWSDVDIIVQNTLWKARIGEKIKFSFSRFANFDFNSIASKLFRSGATEFATFVKVARASGFRGSVKNYEHHACHLASAAYFCGSEQSAALSIDGAGDFGTWSFGRLSDNGLKVGGGGAWPHSIGIFYQACTQWLGFHNYGDEYKVMGLSATGSPRFASELERIITFDDGKLFLDLSYFAHHTSNFKYSVESGQVFCGRIFSDKITDILGSQLLKWDNDEQRSADIAASAQHVFTSILLKMCKYVLRETGCSNLCLAGGCAMNSLAIGEVRRSLGLDNLFVQPAAGDAGGALGAVCLELHSRDQLLRKGTFPYWGASLEVGSRDLELLKKIADVAKIDEATPRFLANALAGGDVIGLARGRAEWGPRALGNRSFLADPRNPNIQDLMNSKVKMRERFRPFAPMVLHDHAGEWFEDYTYNPFMTEVFRFKPGKGRLVPAVCHHDYTGRLQSVTSTSNSFVYDILTEFYNITSVPLILNTSFNENEPIVNNFSEALACFERLNFDHLVVGDYVASKI